MLSVVSITTPTTVIDILYVVAHLIYRAVIVTKAPGVNFFLGVNSMYLPHHMIAHGIKSPGTFNVDVVTD